MSKPDPSITDPPAPVDPRITQVQIGTLMSWLADRPAEPEAASLLNEPEPVEVLPRLFDRLAAAPPRHALEARPSGRDDGAHRGGNEQPGLQHWAMSSSFVLSRRRVVRPKSKFNVSSLLRADPDGEDGWRYAVTQTVLMSVEDLGLADVGSQASLPAPPSSPALPPPPDPAPIWEPAPWLAVSSAPSEPMPIPLVFTAPRPQPPSKRGMWLWLLLLAFAPLIVWVMWLGFGVR